MNETADPPTHCPHCAAAQERGIGLILERDAARAEVERLRAVVAELAEDAADRHWRSRAAAHSYYARILAAMASS